MIEFLLGVIAVLLFFILRILAKNLYASTQYLEWLERRALTHEVEFEKFQRSQGEDLERLINNSEACALHLRHIDDVSFEYRKRNFPTEQELREQKNG